MLGVSSKALPASKERRRRYAARDPDAHTLLRPQRFRSMPDLSGRALRAVQIRCAASSRTSMGSTVPLRVTSVRCSDLHQLR